MRLHVAFTPAESAESPVAVVVDVMRATSTIAQALASGYRRVLCCAEVEEAVALRDALGEPAVLGGERNAVRIGGLAPGGPPREVVCAGFQGAFALDDAYCAGRIVALLDGPRTDAANAAEVIASAYPKAIDGI